MGKLVVLDLAEENFQPGFTVTLQIGEEGDRFSTVNTGYLPPNTEIIKLYRSWKSAYYSHIGFQEARLEKPSEQKSQYSIGEVNEQAEYLTRTMNQWLDSQEFCHIREQLLDNLQPDDEVRFIIQTQTIELRQLPWHLWDLFKRYPFAEVALSAPNYGQVSSNKPSKNKVRILAILGNSAGINIEKDRALLEQLPSAETKFLAEPTQKKISDHLLKYSWDILFFAGHSQTEGDKGRIFINRTDSLTIGELKNALIKTIKKGLRLAIFNSCDGLGLAQELADLQIPQIIVMREPVPDIVAQEFLKYFLEAFANGKSLYLSVREARENLQKLEQNWPGVSWLPIICQNPTQLMPSWDKLRTATGGISHSPIWNAERFLQESQNRNRLLATVEDEVESRLKQSLYNQVVIQLPKQLRPKQVERPWDIEVKLSHLPNQSLAPGKKLIDIFKQGTIAGKLLIIGEPGSGKTTTLLELAKQLITQAENDTDEPIPILLNLSSWRDEKQPLTKWLIAELVSKYGVSLNIAQHWLENLQLLPLLDGLDELETLRQERCVQAINQLLESQYRPSGLVVCSREKGYEFINTKLKVNGAIYLQPIAQAEIQKYFADVKAEKLWQTIKEYDALLKLLESPLMLNLMTLVGHEMALEDEVKFKSTKDLQDSILDAYIQQMLKREITSVSYSHKKEPSAKKTQDWLAWLASKYQDDCQTEFSGFSPEQMQPSWLPNRRYKQIYALGVGLNFGLILGLIVGSIVWLTVAILFDPFWGMVLVSAIALFVIIPSSLWAFLTVGQDEKIEPVATLKFSLKKLFKSLVGGLIAGLITWKLSGMMIFSIVGILVGLIDGVSGPNVEKIKSPNQSISQSFKNASLSALVGAISMAIPAAIMREQLLTMIVESSVLHNKIGTLNIVFSSILLGVIFWFTQPGMACIQHFTLRLILCWKGYIPWNYTRFLDYATERRFLQRVGGRYQFIHKLLQVRLAKWKP